MKYQVDTFRNAGLQAKWSKHQGRPIIVCRNPKAKAKHQRTTWWLCDNAMWSRAKDVGILEAFDEHTLLGDLFSI